MVLPIRASNAASRSVTQNLARDLIQLAPVVPVAHAALYLAERIQQAGIGLRGKLQNVTQLLHLEAKGVDILRVERRPFVQFSDSIHRRGVNFLVLLAGQSIGGCSTLRGSQGGSDEFGELFEVLPRSIALASERPPQLGGVLLPGDLELLDETCE